MHVITLHNGYGSTWEATDARASFEVEDYATALAVSGKIDEILEARGLSNYWWTVVHAPEKVTLDSIEGSLDKILKDYKDSDDA